MIDAVDVKENLGPIFHADDDNVIPLLSMLDTAFVIKSSN